MVFESLALQKLHGNEGQAIVLADFVDGANVGMIQRRGGARFARDSCERLPVFNQLFGKKLEREESAQRGVFSLVHHTHAPTTQLLKNPVAGNDLANHEAASLLTEILCGLKKAVNQTTRPNPALYSDTSLDGSQCRAIESSPGKSKRSLRLSRNI